MTNEEIWAAQRAYREFVATVAGKAFHLFKNRIVSETMYGEKDYPNDAKLRENSEKTKEQEDILVAEIKRLQAVEAKTADLRAQPIVKELVEFLEDTANKLDLWAAQSLNGGWSTHQVEGNRELANECRRRAAFARLSVAKEC